MCKNFSSSNIHKQQTFRANKWQMVKILMHASIRLTISIQLKIKLLIEFKVLVSVQFFDRNRGKQRWSRGKRCQEDSIHCEWCVQTMYIVHTKCMYTNLHRSTTKCIHAIHSCGGSGWGLSGGPKMNTRIQIIVIIMLNKIHFINCSRDGMMRARESWCT